MGNCYSFDMEPQSLRFVCCQLCGVRTLLNRRAIQVILKFV